VSDCLVGSRRRRDHDDLLSGVEEPGSRATELRGFVASALVASLPTAAGALTDGGNRCT
jgi:hypothetical protein